LGCDKIDGEVLERPKQLATVEVIDENGQSWMVEQLIHDADYERTVAACIRLKSLENNEKLLLMHLDLIGFHCLWAFTLR